MQSYPINLLLQNRRCLVVGGGPVALRKVTRLLAAFAKVKVIAPEAVAGLCELATAGKLELVLRRCRDEDLEGVFLLFLASDDYEFNRQLMFKAQSSGILSCVVDKSWPEGDFITPASCGSAGLQLAIATGGQSCVRSKSVKNLLAGQLEVLDSEVVLTTFTIAGENFVEKFNPEFAASVVALLQLVVGVREFAVYAVANHCVITTLLSQNEQINRLLQMLLASAVSGAGNVIKERRGKVAFAYLLQIIPVAEDMQSLITGSLTECRIGSGLQKLNALLSQSETLKTDPQRGWRDYADYCRKL